MAKKPPKPPKKPKQPTLTKKRIKERRRRRRLRLMNKNVEIIRMVTRKEKKEKRAQLAAIMSDYEPEQPLINGTLTLDSFKQPAQPQGAHIRANQWLANIEVNIQPKTESQRKLLQLLDDEKKPVVIVSGPAGTGKTLLSTAFAIKKFIEGKYKKIIICRPNVAVDDRDIGFLPGDINEKMAPWTKPFEDIFLEYMRKPEYEKLIKDGYIEIVPLAYIRGRTFKNAFVIIDEAQGTTPNSLLAILTRIGHGSKYVVTGDVFQSDFKHVNGLNDIIYKIRKFGKLEYISLIEFSYKDIQRHPAITEILELYEEESRNPGDRIDNTISFICDREDDVGKPNGVNGGSLHLGL